MRAGISLQWYLAAFVAAVACFALAAQLIVSIRMSIERGNGWPYGLWMYVAFFTVITNILVALAALAVAFASRRGRSLANPNALTGIAANIILVGATYNLILARNWHPHGLLLFANVALHDAVPVLFVALWWIAVPRGAVRFTRAALWAIYPVVYFAYAMVRGLATGFYPYPFINLAQLGFLRVMLNAFGVLLVFFVLLGALAALKLPFRAAASHKAAQ